jgi:hypothetical protein
MPIYDTNWPVISLNPRFIDFKYVPFECYSGGHSNSLSGNDNSGTEYTFLQFCVTQNIEIAAGVAKLV